MAYMSFIALYWAAFSAFYALWFTHMMNKDDDDTMRYVTITFVLCSASAAIFRWQCHYGRCIYNEN